MVVTRSQSDRAGGGNKRRVKHRKNSSEVKKRRKPAAKKTKPAPAPAPPASAAPLKKVKKVKKPTPARKHRRMSLSVYITRIVQEQHNKGKPKKGKDKISLSGMARKTLNGLALDLAKKLMHEAADVAHASRMHTITGGNGKDGKERKHQPILTAARMVLTGDLATHAISHAHRMPQYFPVGRLHSFMKRTLPCEMRVSRGAAQQLAGILEYVISDILDFTVHDMKAMNRKKKPTRITQRFLKLTMDQDEELSHLLSMSGTIAHGGVVPKIHKALLPPQKRA